jgi:hypothetical protein
LLQRGASFNFQSEALWPAICDLILAKYYLQGLGQM